MQDLEDDPELRANVNLYKDDDIIAQLEAKIGNMTLEDNAKESTLKQDLDKGVSNVGGDHREVKKAVRKTAIGKAIQHQSEKNRLKSDMIIKANMKTKEEKRKVGADDDSDWESAEEDAPAIRLEELLDNLKIDDKNENANAEEDQIDEEEEKEEE